jgi:Zn-dependent protease
LPLVDYSQLLILFMVLLLSLTIHEAAHAWSADLLGDPTPARLGRLTFNPAAHVDPIGTVLFPLLSFVSGFALIGWAKPVPVDVRQLGDHWRGKFVLIAAAGPASNLLLAILAAVVIRLGGAATGSGLDALSASVLFRAVDLNVLLAVFNMVPVPPLDGGNVLAGLLPAPGSAVLARLRPFGMLILYALMLSGVLWAIIEPARSVLTAFLL